MKKIKVYENPPEDTDSHFCVDEYDLVSFFGNDNFVSAKTELCEKAIDFLEHYSCDSDCRGKGGSVFLGEVMSRELLDGKKASAEAIAKTLAVMDRQVASWRHRYGISRDCVAELMTIVSGVEHCAYELRGNCQGDWQGIVAPKLEAEQLRELSTLYFNTGTEYTYTDEDGVSMGIYCCDATMTPTKQKAQIAEEIGCEVGDLEIYRFCGYTKTAKYEKVA